MHYPNLKTLATFILALSLFVGSVIATESSPPMRGNDRSSAVLMNSPTWEIYLSDYGYSDILNYYRGYSHEMLSGEWGGAVSYERWDPASSTWVPKFSWMDPEWIFPDWMTGSTFAVITPLTVSDSNGDTFFDFGYSEIANDDLMIKITHKFIDARTPMGLGIGTGSSFLSEQWILKEEYEIISVSPEPLRNVCYYRFLHGHPSEDFGSANTYQDYDNTFYSYSDPVWPGQEDYIHDIAQWSDFGGHGGNLGTEYIAFHALQAPSDYGLGDYSGHDYGKPATGLHIDIENTGPLMNNHGLYGPAEVAGAMRWLFGPMDMGSSERIDLILSVGGEEFNECDQCDRLVDHESLAIGQTWGNASGDSPGDLAFTEDGIPVHLGTITLGAYTGFNQAEIVNDPAGCLDNQVMNLNNIANVYDIASAVAGTDSVTFLYTDFGGEENLAVNGYPRYEGDITGAPSNIAPGVTCTVYYTDFGNYRCGKVLLVGDVESLLIAGQEF
ncbi:MAG: hypothetical protein QGG33_00135, partial [Candidatus Krumholzibacteria bacterium]|nr:hypothetical protein [Candidatus Krumholzibacteria bacterium]